MLLITVAATLFFSLMIYVAHKRRQLKLAEIAAQRRRRQRR